MNNSGQNNSLAIIIPAFKPLYLKETLQSLADQTNKEFTVYVADDCGPEEIKIISEEYSKKINIRYVRFNENMGKTDLVGQWNRSVRLSNEPWVWLFSDDDIASPNCVEKFYETLKKTNSKYDVYVFNTYIIDKNGDLIQISPSLPQKENIAEFIYQRFAGQRQNCAVNHIFSRKAFEKNNGFIDFELAWYSDDASWIEFSNNSGFYTIENAQVGFRANSSTNISSPHSSYRERKIKAIFDYISWVVSKHDVANINGLKLSQDNVSKLLRRWIIMNLKYAGGLPIPMFLYSLKKMRGFCGGNWITNLIDLGMINAGLMKNQFIRSGRSFLGG